MKSPKGFLTCDLSIPMKQSAMAIPSLCIFRMSDENVNNVELAGRLGVNEKVVRRLLDLAHISRIDRLETALDHFEIQLQLSVRQKPLAEHDIRHHSV